MSIYRDDPYIEDMDVRLDALEFENDFRASRLPVACARHGKESLSDCDMCLEARSINARRAAKKADV